jgi:cell volume regulation protein A
MTALTLLMAALAVRMSTRVGMPSLVAYLGIGLLLGESGLGIDFDDANLTQVLGLTALVVILAEGGLSTRWSTVRPGVGLATALATVGVALSIAVAGAALHWILGLEWQTALLWGAVVSSTDAAAVFSVLRGVKVRSRLAGTLELESGLNDAPAYIAVVLLATEGISWTTPLVAAYQLVGGAILGVTVGTLGAAGLRRAALPAAGLYPIATFAVCLLAFAVPQALNLSGLLGAYLAGVVLGNSRLPHRMASLSFAEGLGWLAQIGLFVLLGLYVSPSRLLAALLPAIVLGAVLLLLARPVSVALTGLAFRAPLRDQVFLSWAGLRGAVPIVLALVALSAGAPQGQRLVDVVFVLVVLLTLLQGGTLAVLARRLGLAGDLPVTELNVDAAPLARIGGEVLDLQIPLGSRLHGVYVIELRLPLGAQVSMLIRDGVVIIPEGQTRLQAGDELVIVAASGTKPSAERRLRAVHRAGRLARWRGETGR